MRIHSPELATERGFITLRAKVSIDRSAGSFPDELWFTFPQRYEHLCSRAIEPFAVALSLLASTLDEEICVDEPFSERLSVGLQEYWKIFTTWAPQKFKPIRLVSKGLVAKAATPAHVAAAFSGGVDSFFSQFPDRDLPPGFQTKYAVFVHGLDIPLKDEDIFECAAANYEAMFRDRGIELVRVKSNVRAFVPDWDLGHGIALCAVGLALGAGVSRFIVPSSMTYTTLKPWGSNPMIDALLSTEQTQIIHDGAFYSRVDKLSLLKDWEPLRAMMRICYAKPDALHNCGQCPKCRRTMMMLDALGALSKFKTFPPVRSSYHFLTCRWLTPHERLCGRQTIAIAAKNGRLDLVWAGRAAMLMSRLRLAVKSLRTRTRSLRRKPAQVPRTNALSPITPVTSGDTR
ncbi:hypothetical protein [Hyphomicrobium sp.]|uniref:hypothetical protein n=1 Tax=Hyphomicrobium sp. TaxID=82 RepID=UPI000FACB1FA|nr:hypothetical protein [Hyphomicrobium sp.]RUO99199.1 MAG: hypothetical protein EKK30_08145 [Hyphomicrobium sp.]